LSDDGSAKTQNILPSERLMSSKGIKGETGHSSGGRAADFGRPRYEVKRLWVAVGTMPTGDESIVLAPKERGGLLVYEPFVAADEERLVHLQEQVRELVQRTGKAVKVMFGELRCVETITPKTAPAERASEAFIVPPAVRAELIDLKKRGGN
jgi:hypothetical protein